MNEWLWSYSGYSADEEGQREALCTVGNGYVATRGALAESAADGIHYPGTYVAGVFNRLTTRIADRDVENESIVNAPNWLPVLFRVLGGEWFSMDHASVEDHHLELDLERALLTRRSRLSDDAGRTLSVTERRFISLADQHLLASETTFVPENFSGAVEVMSVLDGTVQNTGVPRYGALDHDHLAHVDSRIVEPDLMLLEVKTNDSGIHIAQAARTKLAYNGEELHPVAEPIVEDRYAAQRYELELETGTALTVEKTVALFTSLDHGIYSPREEAVHNARRATGFDELLEHHATSWSHAAWRWRR